MIKVKTPAKINLTLEVLNKRDDGFHNIKSIMHSINLYDYLSFYVEDGENEIILSGNSDKIPYDEKNIVYKAINLFLLTAEINNKKVSVFIDKNIPVEAGLAGGSTNAAGTFLALNKYFGNPLNESQIDKMLASLGSDLNFCYYGGCAVCTSRGEIIKKIKSTDIKLSLIKPLNLGISTKVAYQKVSQKINRSFPNTTEKLEALIKNNKFDKGLIFNSFEEALIDDYEELKVIKNNVPNSYMSGSGPTFYALNDKVDYNFGSDYLVIENLKTIPSGVEII